MIILDYQDRRPIYEQITEKFRTLIYQGALPAGSRLPSVRQLAMELSINPNTIQRYDTGAGGTDLSGNRQREFCCRDAADSGKKQRRFSKRISGTCQTWNQHRYDRRRTDDIGSERV